jgi:NAD(P)-dependent dehydrogenase (short-subunit alcohol dehydrogenase family)
MTDNRVIVLTGASRGIGAAAARELAEPGVTLALCARSEAGCAETKAAVEALGAATSVHGFEVADEAQARAAIADIQALHGHIDVLINNAGTGVMGSLEEVPPTRFAEVQRINVMGPYNLICAAAPAMVARGSGAIINITSARAFMPDRFYAAYCSSKAALLSLTQCLAYDFEGPGVKIYALSPGFTQTDLVDEIYARPEFRNAALTPDQGQPPERPAKLLAWLARELPDDLIGKHIQIQFNDITLRAGLESWQKTP